MGRKIRKLLQPAGGQPVFVSIFQAGFTMTLPRYSVFAVASLTWICPCWKCHCDACRPSSDLCDLAPQAEAKKTLPAFAERAKLFKFPCWRQPEYSDEIGTIPPARICIFPGRTNEYDRIVARTSDT